MHTILGANGIIARELSKHLPAYTTHIRQVSRNPRKVNAADELHSADLLSYAEVDRAVAGSEVVYLLAGLQYNIGVWQKQWPIIMNNVIDACKKHSCKLVFFDNVYAYGLVNGTMTEQTPFNPTSKKGEVRAAIATRLLDETRKGNITGMIVRAADFYGPGAVLSVIHEAAVLRLKAGKRAQWIGDPAKIHTFTYTPDAGRAVAMLANTPTAYNQTWHALTSSEPTTGEHFVQEASRILDIPYKKPMAVSTFGVRVIGTFVPVLREFVEMMYQYNNDYNFSSAKFEQAFNIRATPVLEGIKATLDAA